MSVGISYYIFQYLDEATNLYVDDRFVLQMSITDSITSHVKIANVRLADTTGDKYAAYNSSLALTSSNTYRQGQLVRIIHAFNGNVPFAGRIERIEPGDDNGERYIELLLKDHMTELLMVRTSAAESAVDPNLYINFSTQSKTLVGAIIDLVELFRVGGLFNNPSGQRAISTFKLNSIAAGLSPAQNTTRDFVGANIPVIDAIEQIAETFINAAGNVPHGVNFFILTVNGRPNEPNANVMSNEFMLQYRFHFPDDPLTQGLTLVYGDEVGDGDSSTGIYRMPIISIALPNTTDDVYNDITIYGRKIQTSGGADTQIAGLAEDAESIELFGKRSNFIEEYSLTDENEAADRAEVELSKTNRPVTRAMVTTFGYPMYRNSPTASFQMVHSGDQVHVKYPIYDIDEKFEVAEIHWDLQRNMSKLELVKPGSGYPSKWTLEKMILGIYKKADQLSLAARGPGVGLSVSEPADPIDDAVTPDIELMRPVSGALTANISRGFGGAANHVGIDYAVTSVPVYAAHAGIVSLTGNDGGVQRGVFINIDFPATGNRVGFTRYLHLEANSILVNIGDVVTQGQQIATSGNTGEAEPAGAFHLHFDFSLDNPPSNLTVANGGKILAADGTYKINPESYIVLTVP